MEGVIREDTFCFKGSSRTKEKIEWPGKNWWLWLQVLPRLVFHILLGWKPKQLAEPLCKGERGVHLRPSEGCRARNLNPTATSLWCFIYKVMTWSVLNPYIRPLYHEDVGWDSFLTSLLIWIISHTSGLPVLSSSFPLPLFVFLLLSSQALAFPISLLPWALDQLTWLIQ